MHQVLRADLPLFLGTSGAIMGYFLIYSLRSGSGRLHHLLLLPVLTVGMAPSISFAVLKGLLSRGGTFERTPKFGIRGCEDLPGMAFLYRQNNFPYVIMNAILFLYCLLPLIFAWQRGTWFALPLFLLFPFAFALVVARDLDESFRSRLAR